MSEIKEKLDAIDSQMKNAHRIVWPDTVTTSSNQLVFELAEHIKWLLTYCSILENNLSAMNDMIEEVRDAQAKKCKKPSKKKDKPRNKGKSASWKISDVSKAKEGCKTEGEEGLDNRGFQRQLLSSTQSFVSEDVSDDHPTELSTEDVDKIMERYE